MSEVYFLSFRAHNGHILAQVNNAKNYDVKVADFILFDEGMRVKNKYICWIYE